MKASCKPSLFRRGQVWHIGSQRSWPLAQLSGDRRYQSWEKSPWNSWDIFGYTYIYVYIYIYIIHPWYSHVICFDMYRMWHTHIYIYTHISNMERTIILRLCRLSFLFWTSWSTFLKIICLTFWSADPSFLLCQQYLIPTSGIHQEEERFFGLVSHKHHDPQLRINHPHFARPLWQIVFQVGIN